MIRKDHPVFFIIVVLMNVVFLHGLCESPELWNGVIPILDNIQGIKIYAPKIPGFANSEVPQKRGIDQLADFLLNDLSIRGFNNFNVFGHSMGGYIALEMLYQAPQRIESLGLINSTVLADDEAKRKARAKSVQFIRKNGADKYVRELANSIVAPYNAQKPEIWNSLVTIMQNNSKEGVINALESMASRMDHSKTIKDVRIPVLMAAGKDDAIIPSARVFKEAVLPISCSVKLFEGAGHCLPIETPVGLAKMIAEFLLKPDRKII